MAAPGLIDVLQAWMAEAQSELHTSLPGVVRSYDSGTQRASVQPAIKRAYIAEDGIRDVEELPVAHEVPVVFPGSGGHLVTFPVAPGDQCLLVVCSASLEAWLSRGGVVDPEDDRHHNLTDAVCIPGLRHSALPGAALGSGVVVHSSSVQLGSNAAADPVIRRSDLQVFMTALANAISAVPGPATGPAELTALQAALTAVLWPEQMGSAVVKAV